MKKGLSIFSVFFLYLICSVDASETNEKKILVRGDKSFAPFEYLDEAGRPRGFDVDILNAVAEVMNLDVVLSLGAWDDVRRELEEGEIDALLGMRYSEERDQVLDFSVPYIINSSAIFVRDNSSIRSLDDLKGKEVLLQRGDIMEDHIRSLSFAANIILVENQAEALKRLASGQHDAALCSRLRGLYLVNQHQLNNIVTVGSELAGAPYGFAVLEGNNELLAKFDEGLRILKATGQYDKIYANWFGLYGKHSTFKELIVYFLWIFTPLALLFIISMLWSWSLKKQVALKSLEFEEQYKKRKNAEALLESEKRFRKFVEASPVPMITFGADSELIDVNRKFEHLTGYTGQELMDETEWWSRIFPGGNPLRLMLHYDARQGEPEVIDREAVEINLTSRDGGLHHIVCRHAEIDERHILVLNDITKRKQAEKELQDRVRIEAMIANISTHFINVTADNLSREIDWALQQIGQKIGFDRCYVFEFNQDGKTMSNTNEWCASGIEPHIARLQECPLDDFSWYLQELSANGLFYCPSVPDLGSEAQAEKEEWLREGIQSLITVAIFLKGEMIGFIGLDAVRSKKRFSEEMLFLLRIVGEIFANTMERCRAEQNLKAAHRRLQDIIDFLPDATFVIDKQGTVMAWNLAIEKMTGVAKEQMVGQGDYAYSLLLHGERKPVLLDQICSSGGAPQANVHDLKKDGQAFFSEQYLPEIFGGRGAHVWVKASPLYDRQGELVGAIESIRDISERKEVQERLEASNREMEAFVYTVSHDLRSPLTPIIGYAEYLSETYREQLDAQAIKCLAEIKTAGEKMLMLMEDLLDLAKVGKLDPPGSPVNVAEIIEEILADWAPQIDDAKMRIVVVGELPFVRVPRTLLYQVFNNLLANAIFYAGEDGSPIEIGGVCKTGVVTFYVRDHGPGIPASERERIFEAFYRGTTGRKSSGTGIGLATVQKIARTYGGKTWVEETAGGGSTFWIEMQEDKICVV